MLQRLFCAASVFFVFGCVSEPKAVEAPPNVLLTHPPMGAWIEDSTVSVSGQANGLASVDVNGVTVPVVDGWFEHTMVPIHGVNVIEVEGTDVYGDRHFVRRGVLAGPFTTPKTTVEDAAMLRINRTGLAVLEGQLHQWVEPETLAADAIAMNPIYQDSYGFMGWDAVTVSADLDAVSFQVPELTLNPRDGFLYIWRSLFLMCLWMLRSTGMLRVSTLKSPFGSPQKVRHRHPRLCFLHTRESLLWCWCRPRLNSTGSLWIPVYFPGH